MLWQRGKCHAQNRKPFQGKYARPQNVVHRGSAPKGDMTLNAAHSICPSAEIAQRLGVEGANTRAYTWGADSDREILVRTFSASV